MTEYTFEHVIVVPVGTSKPEEAWRILDRNSDFLLGVVTWYEPWGQYTFNALSNVTWSAGVMRDIASFSEQATGERRRTRMLDG